MNNKMESDAKRLAVTLKRFSYDPTTVIRLARALHYTPDQLQEDMRALYNYLHDLEELNQNEEE